MESPLFLTYSTYMWYNYTMLFSTCERQNSKKSILFDIIYIYVS